MKGPRELLTRPAFQFGLAGSRLLGGSREIVWGGLSQELNGKHIKDPTAFFSAVDKDSSGLVRSPPPQSPTNIPQPRGFACASMLSLSSGGAQIDQAELTAALKQLGVELSAAEHGARPPQHGLWPDTMALINSDCDAMRSLEHQTALITPGCPPFQGSSSRRWTWTTPARSRTPSS